MPPLTKEEEQERHQHSTALRQRAKRALLTGAQGAREAKDLLTAAINLTPNSYKLYRLRSIAYSVLHDYDAAERDADKVIALQPELSDGYYHKGFALYHRKEYALAANAFEHGLRIAPTDKVLRQGFWDAVTLLGQNRCNADGNQFSMD